ncbi:MAG: asparagine synthase-related protein [candidate division WOR-3 bacterium]
MLIYCGNSEVIRDKILKFYSKDNVICAEGSILILKNNTGEIQRIENSKKSVIFAEGYILNINRDFLLSLLEPENKCLLRELEGCFSVFIWDKSQNKAIIIDDKLGLNPLYYTFTAQNEVLLSTALEDFVHIFGRALSIDLNALDQYAAFNYVLGERTFIKNILRCEPGTVILWDNRNVIKYNYWNATEFILGERISEGKFLKEFPKTMLRVISDWIHGMKRVGVLLSGGYDSRAILSCLWKLGVKGYAYTWDNPAIEETNIAQHLAKATGFKLRFLPFYPEEENIENLIMEVEKLTDFSFPLFHIGRYNAIKQISGEVDIIFSGQGELIRFTPVPNDYISRTTLRYIYGSDDNIVEHFFKNENAGEIFKDFSYNHLKPVEQLTCFLLYYAYRHDYGMLRYGESKIIPVAMPFFDGRVIELLLRSPFSIARLNSWKRNFFFILKNRKIYYNFVKQMAPHLLAIPLDRGYLQKFDSSYLNIILTGVGSLKNALSSKQKEKKIPPWWGFVYNLLSQNETLDREFYDKQKIKKSLRKFPSWSPEESYELEKVARFELLYRHFFRSN